MLWASEAMEQDPVVHGACTLAKRQDQRDDLEFLFSLYNVFPNHQNSTRTTWAARTVK